MTKPKKSTRAKRIARRNYKESNGSLWPDARLKKGV